MSKEIRPGKMRISINLDIPMHQDMRALTVHYNITQTKVLELALADYINKNKEILKENRTDRIRKFIQAHKEDSETK